MSNLISGKSGKQSIKKLVKKNMYSIFSFHLTCFQKLLNGHL